MTEENQDEIVDTFDDTSVEWHSEDDYEREKARRIKSESTLVEQKRRIKELESQSAPSGEYLTRDDLDIDRFLDKNAELTDYRDDLVKYAKAIAKEKGIPLSQALDKAKILVESDDETIANRQKQGKANITSWESGSSKTSYTMAELDKIAGKDQTEYNRIRQLQTEGKVTVIR